MKQEPRQPRERYFLRGELRVAGESTRTPIPGMVPAAFERELRGKSATGDAG
jgi:hypothetical protein